jgi:signal transduction histidine kinase
MDKLIEYLFQFARSERDEIVLQKEPVDVAVIMQEEIKTALPHMAKKKITASYQPALSQLVVGERDALKEAFGNLLENAVK